MKKGKWEWIWPWHALILAVMLATIFLCDWGVDAVAQYWPVYRAHTLVVDPGHGGEDGGALSCAGRRESDLNLEISLRLRDILELLGYPVVMTRTTDTGISTHGDTVAARKVSDLKNRVSLVNRQENALLISIHQNFFPDSRYSGAQIFYAGDITSQALAQALQTALVDSLNPGSRRQAKKSSGVYLMEQIAHPGILVECGFLSNSQEEEKLATAAYQKDLCCVLAATVSRFLTEEAQAGIIKAN